MGAYVYSDMALDFVMILQIFTSVFLLFCSMNITYNILFHPLAGIPGPFLWRATRLRFIGSLVSGNLVIDVSRLHERYGDIVRTAPDEVSFARADAWVDVFSARVNHNMFARDATFFKPPPGQPDNLITTIDPDQSARMRLLVMPAFSDRQLIKQEPIIQHYAALMINKLMDQTHASENKGVGSIINIVDWFNWFTFDVVGELTLGESFGCLRDTTNHPWVSLIFSSLKIMALAAATRYYAGLEELLVHLLPANLRKMQSDHYATALDKIHRRMKNKTAPDDFMTPMLDNRNNPDFQRMSIPEIESTTSLLLLAGSETTGTTLCGIFNSLVQNPQELRKLEEEIRSSFNQESDITLRNLQNLPFINAVINEGLRLCNPVAGGILRVAPKGGAIVCGHFLPEGTHVAVNSTAMARSEVNFHRCTEFLPDRFLPDHLRPVQFNNDNRSCLKPFGIGVRACLGRTVALSELRLVLAYLIWHFDIAIAPGTQIEWNDLKTYIVVQKAPIRIGIKNRKK